MRQIIPGFALKSIPEYGVWRQMNNRCYNVRQSKFPRYGGRGITVCDRWRTSFIAFLDDMGHRPSPKHTLDRIDNDGNYEPGNCRWTTQRAQQNNRRDNHFITFNGETRSLSEWTRHLGFPVGVISQRLCKLGWDAAKALTTPVQVQRAKP